MNITKRLYAYPVLSEEKDDYIKSVFNVQLEHNMQGVNHIRFNFTILMDNEEMQELLMEGKAEYVIHLECPNTAFRTTVHTISNQAFCEIPIGRLNGKLEIIALLVAKEDIKQFSSKDWNEDYEGVVFDFSRGNILGYKNLPSLDIVKNFEELSNAGSIFMIYKRLTNEPKPIAVNLDASQIKIGLGTQEYEIYSRFCKKTQFQQILNSMIIFPALVYVFEELKQENGIEANEGKAWFVSLNRAYKKRGISFIDEIMNEEKTSIELAQEAMELPLNKALAMMSELYEGDEEED